MLARPSDKGRMGVKTLGWWVVTVNLLTLFKEIITVYTENHTEPLKKECRVGDC
jgi:hypothetical protein